MPDAARAQGRFGAALLLCAFVGLVTACSRSANTAENAAITPTYDTKTGRLTELAFDSNHNGKVDTWTDMNGSRALRTRIDRNEDGKIDRWEYYDEQSKLVKVGFSRADTGTPDAWAFPGADGKTQRIEISSASDEHKIDRWEHYEADTMTAAEEDTNHDGRVDKWETYEAGVLKTAAFDENGDGKPERRLIYAGGILTPIYTDPDGSGNFKKHVVVSP